MKDEDLLLFAEELDDYIAALRRMTEVGPVNLPETLRILHAIEGAAGILDCRGLHQQMPLWERKLVRTPSPAKPLQEMLETLHRYAAGLKSKRTSEELDTALFGNR